MTSKSQLQTMLKEKHGINKNITQPLSEEDCTQLLNLLEQTSAQKLVHSFRKKNSELSNNNRNFGQRRKQAETKLERLQERHDALKKTIADSKPSQRGQNGQVKTEEYETLKAEIDKLKTQNAELVEVNDELKKDNKALKNTVDGIRLQLARKTRALLQYEDSEIRKAAIRLFNLTLG